MVEVNVNLQVKLIVPELKTQEDADQLLEQCENQKRMIDALGNDNQLEVFPVLGESLINIMKAQLDFLRKQATEFSEHHHQVVEPINGELGNPLLEVPNEADVPPQEDRLEVREPEVAQPRPGTQRFPYDELLMAGLDELNLQQFAAPTAGTVPYLPQAHLHQQEFPNGNGYVQHFPTNQMEYLCQELHDVNRRLGNIEMERLRGQERIRRVKKSRKNRAAQCMCYNQPPSQRCPQSLQYSSRNSDRNSSSSGGRRWRGKARPSSSQNCY